MHRTGSRTGACYTRATRSVAPVVMSGNTLGTLFCITSFGESHGPAIGCVVDGCPPGMALAASDIQHDLDRRKPGTSRHVTQRREADTVEILSGLFEGRTTGTPIALLIRNEDARGKDYASIADTFRPGHADYTYWQKYGIRDYRGGGRQSARETAVRVAAGAVARKWLRERYGVTIRGHLTQLGTKRNPVQGLGACRCQSVFRRQRHHRSRARSLHGCVAQIGRLVRRARRSGRPGRTRRLGRAGVWQARRRSRRRDDGHQRGQGRRNRGWFRQHQSGGHRALRRNDTRRFRIESRWRNPWRHFDRSGHRRVDRGQANLIDPARPAQHRQGRQPGLGQHPRPPRPVRRDSRDAHRRGDARDRPDGSCLAPSGAEWRRGLPESAARSAGPPNVVRAPGPSAIENPDPDEA